MQHLFLIVVYHSCSKKRKTDKKHRSCIMNMKLEKRSDIYRKNSQAVKRVQPQKAWVSQGEKRCGSQR